MCPVPIRQMPLRHSAEPPGFQTRRSQPQCLLPTSGFSFWGAEQEEGRDLELWLPCEQITHVSHKHLSCSRLCKEAFPKERLSALVHVWIRLSPEATVNLLMIFQLTGVLLRFSTSSMALFYLFRQITRKCTMCVYSRIYPTFLPQASSRCPSLFSLLLVRTGGAWPAPESSSFLPVHFRFAPALQELFNQLQCHVT